MITTDTTAAVNTSAPETTGSAPSFAKDATWSDAPSASPDGVIAGTETTPATATGSPAPATPDGTIPQQDLEPTGPIPLDRHKAILESQRTKAVLDHLTGLGLHSFTPAQLKAIAPWVQKASTDPDGFVIGELTSHADPVGLLQKALQQLQRDPKHGATLRSVVGRAMQQLRGQPAAPTPPPMVKVQLEDGSVVDMPRDPGAWLQFHQQQWLAQVKQEFAPMTQTLDQLREQQQAAERDGQIEAFVTTTHQDVLTWPGMQDAANREAVAADLARSVVDPNDPSQIGRALDAAWRRLVVPTLTRSAESAMLDKLKTQAAASTGINPGSAAPSAPRAITKFADLGRDAWGA